MPHYAKATWGTLRTVFVLPANGPRRRTVAVPPEAPQERRVAEREGFELATYLAFSSKRQALAFESYLKTGSGYAFSRKRLWP